MQYTSYKADEGTLSTGALSEWREDHPTGFDTTAGLAKLQGWNPHMPMAKHQDNNARPGIKYNDAAAVELPLIRVDNNVLDDGISKGYITSAAEGR